MVPCFRFYRDLKKSCNTHGVTLSIFLQKKNDRIFCHTSLCGFLIFVLITLSISLLPKFCFIYGRCCIQGLVTVRTCKGSFCSIWLGSHSEQLYAETASCYQLVQQPTKTAQIRFPILGNGEHGVCIVFY